MNANRLSSVVGTLGLLAALACPGTVSAQDSEAGSKAPWIYGKSPAVAARAPGLRIRRAVRGPDITQTEAQADEITRVQGIYIDIINTLFTELSVLIPLLPELFDLGAPSSGIGDLVITEVANDGTNTYVEVYNPSGLRIQLDSWAFCKLEACSAAQELSGVVMESGDLRVFQLGQFDGAPANQSVTIQVGTTADDLGLYDFTGAASRDPEDRFAMRDYVQWGGSPAQLLGLEEVAVSAGLWLTNSTIPGSLAEMSFQLSADRLDRGGLASDYIVGPFSETTLGQLTAFDASSGDAARVVSGDTAG